VTVGEFTCAGSAHECGNVDRFVGGVRQAGFSRLREDRVNACGYYEQADEKSEPA
jgi:hypothetical protein